LVPSQSSPMHNSVMGLYEKIKSLWYKLETL
jgi:hypothetical protein